MKKELMWVAIMSAFAFLILYTETKSWISSLIGTIFAVALGYFLRRLIKR